LTHGSGRKGAQSAEPEQQFFLRELWTLAWAASVQRANLYAPGSRQTGQLRDMLQGFITTRILPHYVGFCLGQISEPPHCPIDRIIIEKTHLRGRVNWTEIVDEDQYRAFIEAVRRKAEPESIARWELWNYRRRSSL
jgi:hypothetical protein